MDEKSIDEKIDGFYERNNIKPQEPEVEYEITDDVRLAAKKRMRDNVVGASYRFGKSAMKVIGIPAATSLSLAISFYCTPTAVMQSLYSDNPVVNNVLAGYLAVVHAIGIGVASLYTDVSDYATVVGVTQGLSAVCEAGLFVRRKYKATLEEVAKEKAKGE